MKSSKPVNKPVRKSFGKQSATKKPVKKVTKESRAGSARVAKKVGPKTKATPGSAGDKRTRSKAKQASSGGVFAKEAGGRPLCFVLMPFGKKADGRGGKPIDFDAIYDKAIKVAIIDAGMDPIRADAETTGGIIHKAMFERLLLCDYAVADLTTANPNVFYELGVRHTARPRSTIAIHATGNVIPFDVRYLRQLPYELGPKNAFGDKHAEGLKTALQRVLEQTRRLAQQDAPTDSPLYQLLQGYKAPELAHLATDTFREHARYSGQLRQELAKARAQKSAAVKALQAIQGRLEQQWDAVEPGVLVDLYLSYRSVKAWDEMIALHAKLPQDLKRTVVVREQLAFALNRRKEPGDSDQALEVLRAVEKETGANPETCGLIGRIYKDRWQEALENNDQTRAVGFLAQALEAYLRGYEADWRDAYPGVNAVTLLELRGTEADLAKRDRLVGVVQYAVDRKIQAGEPDYWDYATQLELSVIQSDRERSDYYLSRTLASIRESFEPETTANNLRMIVDARRERGAQTGWIEQLVEALVGASP